jgi:hypothetical protein
MKITTVLTIVLLTARVAHGQHVTGGLKFGFNIAGQKFDVEDFDTSPQSRVSVHVGLFFEAQVTEQFSIQPEIVMSSVGSKHKIDGEQLLLKCGYLTFPVLARYNPSPSFNIHAGPQFGLLMGSSVEVSTGQSGEFRNLRTGDIGLAAGAGVESPGGFVLSMRYVHGLTNIEGTRSSNDVIKNRVFQISIGYRIGKRS